MMGGKSKPCKSEDLTIRKPFLESERGNLVRNSITIRQHSLRNACRNFYEKFKVLSLKMKAWHVNRRRERVGRRRREGEWGRRREEEGRGREGEWRGKKGKKAECKSCSLLIVADNSFYKEVISISGSKSWQIENQFEILFPYIWRRLEQSFEFLWKFKNLKSGMQLKIF